ncbi:mRNA surveillance protein Pelota, partial [Candidatus Woesearchaeota archaeon CG_4_10_14_0_8_um_filter_47_5]
MKILSKNMKKGHVVLQVETLDDLWYLSELIEKGDIVKGKTVRKIKLGKETDRDAKVVKKTVFLSIRVAGTEFHEFSDVLRVGGTVTEGPDDVARGTHHTFSLSPGSAITLEKPKWYEFHLQKLEDARKADAPQLIVCAHDRSEAVFFLVK